jgi:putative transposase
MRLVERHIIDENNQLFNECDILCLKTKNLYNTMLYYVRQSYINDGLNELYNLHSIFKTHDVYKALPAKVSSSVLLLLQKNFKSFFKSINDFRVNPNKYKGRPHLPKYLDKNNGRFIASFTNQAISKKVFTKTNKIKLSGFSIEIFSKITDFKKINCVRVVPRDGYYVIEVVYTIDDVPLKQNNGKYLSIDLGLNNLATCVSNVKNLNPFIINGKPLKSINHFYNKKVSYYKSKLEKNNKKTSKRLNRLNLKRNNKISNYLFKSVKEIIQRVKDNNLNTIIIGNNKEWKQNINIGKKNNQNFVQIPHSRFIDIIKYKCEIEGINVKIQEESYTSKCSFLDSEEIKKHETYKGKRIKRGLFKTFNGKIINADVNAGYNILKKAIPNAFADGIEGLGVTPLTLKLKR